MTRPLSALEIRLSIRNEIEPHTLVPQTFLFVARLLLTHPEPQLSSCLLAVLATMDELRLNSGSSSTPLRPANLLTVFQGHFHVRRGNLLTFQHGHDIDLSGVEWKILPSGAHALHRDLLWFIPPGPSVFGDRSDSVKFHKVGVAVFCNRRLDQSGPDNEVGQDDQRGARMIAVGIIVACESLRPSSHLAACLPHIKALHSLTERSADDPRNHQILQDFLKEHRFDPSEDIHNDLVQFEVSRCPTALSRWAVGPWDPLLDLPSIANALGLLLPQILRKLLIRGSRLLIFSPLGSQAGSAASVAWTLAEIVQDALASPEVDYESNDGQDRRSSRSKSFVNFKSSRQDGLPIVRGILSLPDLGQLQEEQRERATLLETGDGVTRGWISWTTERLFLENSDLYDCLLDLSPLYPSHAASASSANAHSPSFLAASEISTPAAAPIFSLVKRSWTKDGRRRIATLKATAWHPRDFAIYCSNEHRSVKLAGRPKSLDRQCSRSSVHLSSFDNCNASDRWQALRLHLRAVLPNRGSLNDLRLSSSKNHTSSTILLSHLIAFVRYWLSSLWFIPQRWRVSLREGYGYVPISIRPDCGVQAGIMILPDSDNEDDGSEEDFKSKDVADRNSDDSAQPENFSCRMPVRAGNSRRNRMETASSDSTISHKSDKYLTVPSQTKFGHHEDPTVIEDEAGKNDEADSLPGFPGSRQDVDSLLVACGAHSPAGSKRLSRTGSSSRLVGGAPPKKVAREMFAKANQCEDVDVDQEEQMAAADGSHVNASLLRRLATDPTPLPLRFVSHASASRSTPIESGKEPQLADKTWQQSQSDSRLARAIFTTWSKWLRELVLEIKSLATSVNQVSENLRDDERSDTDTSDNLAPLSSRQLTSLGLNARNDEDRALVQDLVGREVSIGYWKFWGSWF